MRVSGMPRALRDQDPRFRWAERGCHGPRVLGGQHAELRMPLRWARVLPGEPGPAVQHWNAMSGRPAATSFSFQVSVSDPARPCCFNPIDSRAAGHAKSALLPSTREGPAQPSERAQSGPGPAAPPRIPPSPSAARTFTSLASAPRVLIFLRVKAGVTGGWGGSLSR